MKVFFSLLFSISLFIHSYAQTSEDKVSQLIAAENYFNAQVKEKGLKKAFLAVCDNNTIVFRPDPMPGLKFYRNQPDSIGHLFLEPQYAKIAKSTDWGFTCGSYMFKQREDSEYASYGTYVSVWKKGNRGIWRLALDAGVAHKKPASSIKKMFINPADEGFLHQKSTSRLKQREDIVLSSDKLLGTITKADNKIAQNEFLTESSWLLFPGQEPLIGKKAIMNFWKTRGYKAITEPVKADRSFSGELAFTYGTASILAKKYNYIRIWEVQPNYKWNVIVEVFTEANGAATEEPTL